MHDHASTDLAGAAYLAGGGPAERPSAREYDDPPTHCPFCEAELLLSGECPDCGGDDPRMTDYRLPGNV